MINGDKKDEDSEYSEDEKINQSLKKKIESLFDFA
jgi:hypothetical protein